MRLKNRFSWFIGFYIVLLAIMVASRPLHTIADTPVYARAFIDGMATKSLGRWEIGFELFIYPLHYLANSPHIYFFCISLLVYGLLYKVSKESYRLLWQDYSLQKVCKNWMIATIFFLCLLLPTVLGFNTNGIRHGISALFFLLGFLKLENNEKKGWLYIGLSLTFHNSSFMLLPCLLLLKFLLKTIGQRRAFLVVIFLFLVFSFLYLTNISPKIVAFLSQLTGIDLYSYINDYGASSGYRRGVRYDFYLYTSILLMASYILMRSNKRSMSFYLMLIISTYPFLFLGWGSYSNRYILSNWFYLDVFIISLWVYNFSEMKYFSPLLLILSVLYPLIYILLKT